LKYLRDDWLELFELKDLRTERPKRLERERLGFDTGKGYVVVKHTATMEDLT